jgi:hypothetical protein
LAAWNGVSTARLELEKPFYCTTDHALLLCSHLRLRGGGPRAAGALPPPPPTLHALDSDARVLIRRRMEAVKHRAYRA